jgi:hypothetical protein
MMRRRLSRTLQILAFTAALGAAYTPNANAALILSAMVGGVQICATDNNAACGFGMQIPDVDPAVGVLSLGAAPVVVGGLAVSGSLHTQIIGPLNILNSASLSVANTTGAPLTASVAVGATGFSGPATSATASGSGTFVNAIGSTITLNWCNDPTNSQGAETNLDRPGLCFSPFTFPTTLNPQSYSTNQSMAVNDPSLFSMTVAFDLTLVGGGSLISRGQSEIKPQPQAVPEPATIMLLGSGLFATAAAARRRVRRK